MNSAHNRMTDLKNSVNWTNKFPDYVFSKRGLRGFFIIDSGLLTTRGFLDFMLGLNLKINGDPLAILVHLNEKPENDLYFSASSIDEIKSVRTDVMRSSLELFEAIIVVSGAPSKWIAYEEIAEDFAVLAVFDGATWERWSAKESGIWDYVIGENDIAAKLMMDEWPGWNPDFLSSILVSYGEAGRKRSSGSAP